MYLRLSLILLARLLVHLRQAAHTERGNESQTSFTHKRSVDLPTQMSDVLFVAQSSIPDSGKTELSTTIGEEDLEIAIMDGDSPIDEVDRLESSIVK